MEPSNNNNNNVENGADAAIHNGSAKGIGTEDVEKIRVTAVNHLRQYCRNMLYNFQQGLFKNRVSSDDRRAVSIACEGTLLWLEHNFDADKKDIDLRQDEVESVCIPIIALLCTSRPSETIAISSSGVAGFIGSSSSRSLPELSKILRK